jgi:uncharacterized repeat protein (TIGR02543 family)
MKNLSKMSTIILLCAMALSSCSKPDDGKDGTNGTNGTDGADGKNSYLVVFDSDGGTPMFSINGVKHGNKITAPENPVKKDGAVELIFRGWYAIGAAAPFDFNTPITDNITLTAKWAASPLGTWINIDDVGGWGFESILIIAETEWEELGGGTWSAYSWAKSSNEDADSKDDYPDGYFIELDGWKAFIYLHKTDPNKLLFFNYSSEDYDNYNIYTRDE